MAEQSPFLAEKRYAVVTGANKGIGLEVCRQLAAQGVVVILTSRDEKRGLDNLRKSGLNSDNLEFHQLDVTDPTSVASLAHFIDAKFGKLDILVNNAGILGAIADFNALFAAGFPEAESLSADMVTQTYVQAQECLQTNYYGVKTATEALLPLLKLSNSPRIINVSSAAGKLCHIRNDQIRGILANAEELTEERVDSIVDEFLRDFKDGTFVEKGWIPVLSAYFASKAALNAYTRILAKKHPTIIINCLCPGFIKTDINNHVGPLPVEQGGARVVRLALAPHASPSGLFYTNDQVTPF
ncbi:hypothetical protein RND81_03G206200 [Saponaria officinalis]|uniref:(+)-neomenthol dehydrogenase-like n=1 Tax=Saponaria officinalis TaxID=3572 RepID=A0AAW1M1L7_SAPOF